VYRLKYFSNSVYLKKMFVTKKKYSRSVFNTVVVKSTFKLSMFPFQYHYVCVTFVTFIYNISIFLMLPPVVRKNCEGQLSASLDLSVRPSAWNNSAPLKGFPLNFVFEIFSKNLSRKFHFH
jgi:hypothetical protein